MSLQTYEVVFNNKNYCINEINDIIKEISKYIPENSCSSLKKCINNLFLNNLRPSKKNFSPKPENPALYRRVKARIKKKTLSRGKTWPSAYASGQLVQAYKRAGGTYI